ncbi:YccS/YhfK family putative transporter [Tatumella sp. OPLPL6]|uniref:YccS/YhfK family putative transporter n=1 Tax=Tatumella sp. OPLPL6 TaxID=1928657 RepID=UPI000C191A51|nr:YccS/YhfK family putative transporter [Tatumella sp. OPLPL6]PIJ43845.1 hypothetical protein BOM24_07520 [Tatumella sp. OPLPL6]
MLRRLIYHPEVNYAFRQTLVLCLPIALGWLLGDLHSGLLFSLVPSCCNLAGLDTPHKRFFKRLVVGGLLFACSSFLLLWCLQQHYPLPLFLFALPLIIGVTGEISPLHGRLLPASLVAAVLSISLAGRMPIWGPPLLYLGGTVWYGVFNWAWFKFSQAQQLRETLSLLYRELGNYCEHKYHRIFSTDDSPESLQDLLKRQQKVIDLITQCYQQLHMLPAARNRNDRFLIRYFLMAQDIQEHITISLNQPDEIKKLCHDSFGREILNWNANTVASQLHRLADDILYHQFVKPFSMSKQISALEKLAQQFPHNPVPQFCFYHFTRIARVLQNEKPLYQRDLMRDRQRRLPLLPALKSYLSLKSTALRSAARFSIMLMCGGIVGMALNMPKPYWILMTIVFVSQNNYSATRVRIQHRALGTFAGLIIAAVTLNLHVPESWILIIMLLITFFSNLFNRQYYGWATIGFTVTAVYSLQLLSLNGHQFLVPRLLDTLLGCLIAFGGTLWLWPQWQSALLRDNTLDVLNAYQHALKVLLGPEQKDEVFEAARVEANQKHNALFNALNQAMQEPGFDDEYLEEMHLWVSHSQYIVEHINELTALAREHTMLTPTLAERYLQACEIALQQCQQRLLYANDQENYHSTHVMDEAANFDKGPSTIVERHIERILVHVKSMRTISAIIWTQRPKHGAWFSRVNKSPEQ